MFTDVKNVGPVRPQRRRYPLRRRPIASGCLHLEGGVLPDMTVGCAEMAERQRDLLTVQKGVCVSEYIRLELIYRPLPAYAATLHAA